MLKRFFSRVSCIHRGFFKSPRLRMILSILIAMVAINILGAILIGYFGVATLGHRILIIFIFPFLIAVVQSLAQFNVPHFLKILIQCLLIEAVFFFGYWQNNQENQSILKEGKKLFDQKEYAQARQKFRQAWDPLGNEERNAYLEVIAIEEARETSKNWEEAFAQYEKISNQYRAQPVVANKHFFYQQLLKAFTPQKKDNHCEFRHRHSDIVCVMVPCGDFLFGEKKIPVHVPTFLIGKYEVSLGEWNRFMPPLPGDTDLPVTQITWDNQTIRMFCEKTQLTLPHEVEWEKAASWNPKIAQPRDYPWGNDSYVIATAPHVYRMNSACYKLDELGQKDVDVGFGLDQYRELSPTHAFPQGQSFYGCFNMAGNAAELTMTPFLSAEDALTHYLMQIEKHLQKMDADYDRIQKGGCWESPVERCKCSFRENYPSGKISNKTGLRVCWIPPIAPDCPAKKPKFLHALISLGIVFLIAFAVAWIISKKSGEQGESL